MAPLEFPSFQTRVVLNLCSIKKYMYSFLNIKHKDNHVINVDLYLKRDLYYKYLLTN